MSLFQSYAQAVQPFRNVISSTPTPNAFSTMTKLDQNKGCHLSYAADMCRALTDGLLKLDQVYKCQGIVTAADLKNVSFRPLEESSEDLIAHFSSHQDGQSA